MTLILCRICNVYLSILRNCYNIIVKANSLVIVYYLFAVYVYGVSVCVWGLCTCNPSIFNVYECIIILRAYSRCVYTTNTILFHVVDCTTRKMTAVRIPFRFSDIFRMYTFSQHPNRTKLCVVCVCMCAAHADIFNAI